MAGADTRAEALDRGLVADPGAEECLVALFMLELPEVVCFLGVDEATGQADRVEAAAGALDVDPDLAPAGERVQRQALGMRQVEAEVGGCAERGFAVGPFGEFDRLGVQAFVAAEEDFQDRPRLVAIAGG